MNQTPNKYFADWNEFSHWAILLNLTLQISNYEYFRITKS
ncbi:MAG: hypothetical protein JWP81_5333 [Ferruginibacter sp.]|nr:hypothetical protein [Ferruginibacter sp.]